MHTAQCGAGVGFGSGPAAQAVGRIGAMVNSVRRRSWAGGPEPSKFRGTNVVRSHVATTMSAAVAPTARGVRSFFEMLVKLMPVRTNLLSCVHLLKLSDVERGQASQRSDPLPGQETVEVQRARRHKTAGEGRGDGLTRNMRM